MVASSMILKQYELALYFLEFYIAGKKKPGWNDDSACYLNFFDCRTWISH